MMKPKRLQDAVRGTDPHNIVKRER